MDDSPTPRGIAWVRSLHSPGGQTELEIPERCLLTSGASVLRSVAAHSPQGTSSFHRVSLQL